MRAPTTLTRAKARKRTCRGPRLERALALRSVGMARVEVWVGTRQVSMGIHVSIVALPRCATRSVAHSDVTRRMLLARHSRGRLHPKMRKGGAYLGTPRLYY